jgi:succinoglycan biosynthesis protein ExoA
METMPFSLAEPDHLGRPPPDAAKSELVTVVIPARNEERFIGACLDSVLAQDHSNLQVIVVDGASRDRTASIVTELASRDPRVELLSNPEGTTPASLNVGLRATRARWFIRIDAHSMVPSDYVRRALGHLQTGEWGGVGGRKNGAAVTPSGEAIAAAMASRFGVGNSTYHFGTSIQTVDHIPFGAYPTDVLRELGGWDERLRVNQDFEFDYRVRKSGRKLLFDPDLVIAWHCRQSIPDLFKQYRRYGRGKAVVARLYPTSLRPRHLAAPALVALWAGSLAVATRRPRLAAAALLPYGVALGVASFVTSRKVADRAGKIRVPLAFVAMHGGWGIGFWEGLPAALAGEAR